ncbi:LysR substrate-binding domain-containing protein [Nitratireductor kimnyeongensis]|uniref:LysR substrate-binding domain-containing protein n=1 Tax=Nitratireductor kimnyeongensis TaxID=430679 RepID=A0ABW0TEH5_9HYPH|nr:LysR substrate-binding domain-containing protein [Nitratireductor kimnyeongensis]QZZ36957.1 LysR family transcriptional regulator [Nitratireductor kimnyeongensis]
MELPRRLIPSVSGLIAFEATARHLSFSQAAKDLSLSQGAVSKRVRQLEQMLGVALLARNNHQVHLTEMGQRYLPQVRTLLGQLESSTRALMQGADGKTTITMAAPVGFSACWLISRLGDFQKRHANLSINLITSKTLLETDDETVDCAIVQGTPQWGALACTPLFEEELVPVASPHFMRSRRPNSPDKLHECTLLHLSGQPDLWAEWFEQAGCPRSAFPGGPQFDQFPLLIMATVQGQGTAIIPRFMVERELASGELEVVFDVPLRSRKAYHFVMPARSASDRNILALRSWIMDCVAGDAGCSRAA